jgi:hypothetical protein
VLHALLDGDDITAIRRHPKQEYRRVSCVFRGSWTRVSLEAGQVFRAKLDSRSAATQGFLFLL